MRTRARASSGSTSSLSPDGFLDGWRRLAAATAAVATASWVSPSAIAEAPKNGAAKPQGSVASERSHGRSAEGKASPAPAAAGVYAGEATSLSGETVSLSRFAGKPALFVNVASKCGYTPQYEKLQALYAKYKDRGFVVLGFPSNDFGGQEPGTAQEIATFCKMSYGVTFPLFAKNPVSGPNAQPTFKKLVAGSPEPESGEVKWNFEKFLVDGKGQVVARFRSGVDPMDPTLVQAVEKLLAP